MRRDFYLGGIVSLGLHFGLASFHSTPAEVIAAAKLPEVITTVFNLKPDEVFEDVPPGDTKQRSSAQSDFRPPSLPDVPQVPRPDSVIIPVQPALEGKIDRTMVSAPAVTPRGTGGDGVVFDPSMLDQQPVPKVQAKPVYPFEMRRAGITGEVWVDFIVDANGAVRSAYAVRSTRREFEAAAVQAVSKWTFRPGKKDGRAANVHMQVPIVFSLNADRD